MPTVRLRRSGPRQFVGMDFKNHAVALDIAPEFGGEHAGLKPSDLLPLSLGACIAVTAVGILEKMRQGPFQLEVDVNFEQSSEPPRGFTKFDLTWHFRGGNLSEEKIRKAIETADERYCSVSGSLRDDIPVRHNIAIEAAAIA